MINEIQSDVNQKVAKELSKMKQLSGEARTNPFQADLELNLLATNRNKLMEEITEAVAKVNLTKFKHFQEMQEISNKR